jgi:putative ABC transport system permease protein
MRSIIIIILKNIKMKRLQSLLIALIITLSTAIFFTSMGILFSVKEPFKGMYGKLNASHDLIGFYNKDYDIEKLKTWWSSQEEVKSIEQYKAYNYNGKCTFDGKEFNYTIMFAERHLEEAKQDKLLIVEGEKKDNPSKGEIWVTTGIAYQNNIKPGEILSITINNKNIDFKVSAIVVDPQYSSPMLNPTRMWIAPGELELIFNDSERLITSVGIIYEDSDKSDIVWDRFLKATDRSFIGSRSSYSFIEYVYTFQFKLIAAVLIVIACIIIIVTIFIISYTITNAVLSDYKTIGVLKAQGLSNRDILWIYSGQFFILSVLSIIPGIFCGGLFIREIMNSFLKIIGVANMDYPMIIPISITSTVIISIVTIASYMTATRAGNIKPAEAIRYGAPPKTFIKATKTSLVKLKSVSLPLALAIRQCFNYKKQSIFMFITLLVTAFMIIFTVNIRNSLIKLGKNLAYWGFDGSKVQVTRGLGKGALSHEILIQELKGDKRVKVAIPWYYLDNSYVINSRNNTSKEVTAFIYDGNMDNIGVLNIEGRNPRTSDEVSIAINTSRTLSKSVGDYIDITIRGKTKTFLVSGVYQAMINNAEGYRAQKSAIIDVEPNFEAGAYSIVFNEGADIEAFSKDFEMKFGNNISIKDSSDTFGKIFSNVGSTMSIPILLIGGVFIVVSFINIFNIVLISVYEEKKSYGIFKALGFTSNQIRNSIIYRVLALASFSILIGAPLSIIVSPKIVELILSDMGIVKFPFVIDTINIVLSIIIFITVIFMGVWIPSSKVLHISLRELIEE